jgi:hypothetical protein
MELYYEAENINAKLSRMNEPELLTEYAQGLMDRLEEIRRIERCTSW